MPTLDEIEQVYTQFDKVLPRPTSFHNERCCVTRADERPLLSLPREEITESMLAMPVDHYGSCFGTFEEIAYFVPRLVELLDESEDGFQEGSLHISFFRAVRDDEARYRAVGVWDSIENAMCRIFTERTAAFRVEHFDRAACERKGWGITHLDLVRGTDGIDDLLDGFFRPVLSKRQTAEAPGLSAWDAFFVQWASDENPNRIAHLLDIIRRDCRDLIPREYSVPASFADLLKQRNYRLALLERARPALATPESPTWLEDVLNCLEEDSWQ